MQVVRPVGRIGPFTWVHLEQDGLPLCGRQYDDWYTFQIEELGEDRVCSKCMAIKNEYECSQAGQKRSYGDSFYVYDIVDKAEKPRSREEVLKFCQEYIKASYPKSEMLRWSSPELREFSRVGPHTWRYVVVLAWTG